MLIQDLKTFAIPADEHKDLVDVTVWYGNMPDCLNEVVGDRFGENVEQFRQGMLDSLVDQLEVIEGTVNYWISTFEVTDGKLYCLIGSSGNEELHKVELTIEG